MSHKTHFYFDFDAWVYFVLLSYSKLQMNLLHLTQHFDVRWKICTGQCVAGTYAFHVPFNEEGKFSWKLSFFTHSLCKNWSQIQKNVEFTSFACIFIFSLYLKMRKQRSHWSLHSKRVGVFTLCLRNSADPISLRLIRMRCGKHSTGAVQSPVLSSREIVNDSREFPGMKALIRSGRR